MVYLYRFTLNALKSFKNMKKLNYITLKCEKSEQIINRFKQKGYINDNEIKEMALIVASEVIEQCEYIDTYLADRQGELNPNLKYWYEVFDCLNNK